MKNEEYILNEAFEKLLDKAAEMVAEKIGSAEIESDEPIVLSEEHNRKMQAIFDGERKKLQSRKRARFAKRAACIVLPLLIVFSGVCVWSADAWRTRFINFVMEITQPNSDYTSREGNGNSYVDTDVELAYMPTGFKISNRLVSDERIRIMFESEDKYFAFISGRINDNSNIDTEDANAESLSINGFDAIYVTNSNVNAVAWNDNEMSFRVYGSISKEELIKIAENVKILKK